MSSKKNNRIKLSKEKKEEMLSEIQSYFLNERNEEIGNLAAGLLLDFIIEKIAPEFINQGIYEAYHYIDERLEDVLGLQI
jgi:uncharacterized protein (DUF2164 family)